MTTDTSEKGLEALILADTTAGGWIAGDPKDYSREYAVDLAQLHEFCIIQLGNVDATRGNDPLRRDSHR